MKKIVGLMFLLFLPVPVVISARPVWRAAASRHFSYLEHSDGLRTILPIVAFLDPWERLLQILQTDIYLLLARYIRYGSYQDHCDRVIDRIGTEDYEIEQGKVWVDNSLHGLSGYRVQAGHIVSGSFERLKTSGVFFSQGAPKQASKDSPRYIYKHEILSCVQQLIQLIQKAQTQKSLIIMK